MSTAVRRQNVACRYNNFTKNLSLDCLQQLERYFCELVSLPIDNGNFMNYFNTWQNLRDDIRMHDVTNFANISQQTWKECFTNPKKFWEKVNWSGCYKAGTFNEKPSINSFVQHFKSMLFNPDCDLNLDLNNYFINIPMLDVPFSLIEFEECVNALKISSSPGLDGLHPVLIKALPIPIFNQFLTLMNNIYFSDNFPEEWCVSRLVTIHKKGCTKDVNNYRGICVPPTLCKIYDLMISKRLNRWAGLSNVQSGFVSGKSCLNHITTIKLLSEYAVKVNKKLFICCMDLSKAFDTINRKALFKKLMNKGIGKNMLLALVNMYKNTWCSLDSENSYAKFRTNIGVRQGYSSSGVLFDIYIDDLPEFLSRYIPVDDFLLALHILLHADDSAILATTRKSLLNKISKYKEYCDLNDLKINWSKCKFICVNGSIHDKQDIFLYDNFICCVPELTYLGALISEHICIEKTISSQLKLKCKDIDKFNVFLSENIEMPLNLKQRILFTCVLPAVLYASESWLTDNLKYVEKLYKQLVVRLLGINMSIPFDIVLSECGFPVISDKIKIDQRKFWLKNHYILNNHLDPLGYAAMLNRNVNGKQMHFLGLLIATNINQIAPSVRVRNNIGSRFTDYLVINPTLSVHSIYSQCVPEFLRIIFTRLRLSCLPLSIESGRRDNIPREQRLCICLSDCETVSHFLLHCIKYIQIRQFYRCIDFSSITSFFNSDINEILNFINKAWKHRKSRM